MKVVAIGYDPVGEHVIVVYGEHLGKYDLGRYPARFHWRIMTNTSWPSLIELVISAANDLSKSFRKVVDLINFHETRPKGVTWSK